VKNFGAAIKSLEGNPSWKPVYKYKNRPNFPKSKDFSFSVECCRELSKWADATTGNLLQTRFFCWMDGIVNKFANKYNQGSPPQEV
jgi:hypothetical protein